MAAGAALSDYVFNCTRDRNPIGNENEGEVASLYGQYKSPLGNNFYLTLGFRLDDYTELNPHTSPRLGLTWTSPPAIHLLIYGEAFAHPLLMKSGLINNSQVVGNPDLEHEIVKTTELIYHKHLRSVAIPSTSFITASPIPSASLTATMYEPYHGDNVAMPGLN